MTDDRLLRMELREYQELVLLTSLGDKARVMVRRVVVEGWTYTAAGAEHGFSRQAAANAVRRFVAAIKRHRKYPPEWQHTTLILPPGLAATMRYLHDAAAKASGLAPQYATRQLPTLTKPEQQALVTLLTQAGVAPVT